MKPTAWTTFDHHRSYVKRIFEMHSKDNHFFAQITFAQVKHRWCFVKTHYGKSKNDSDAFSMTDTDKKNRRNMLLGRCIDNSWFSALLLLLISWNQLLHCRPFPFPAAPSATVSTAVTPSETDKQVDLTSLGLHYSIPKILPKTSQRWALL